MHRTILAYGSLIGIVFALPVGVTYGNAREVVPYALQPIVLDGAFSAVRATDINEFGNVSLYATVGGPVRRAFIWSDGGGGVELIGAPGTVSASAYALNNQSQVVGDSLDASSSHSVLWMTTASTHNAVDLGNVNAPNPSGANAALSINDSGLVVGVAFDNVAGGDHAYLWIPSVPNGGAGTLVSLGGGGGSDVLPFDINSHGTVIGVHGGIISSTVEAFIWRPDTPNGAIGTTKILAELPPDLSASSNVSAINDASTVVGAWKVASQPTTAFRWRPLDELSLDGTVQYLGMLPGVDPLLPLAFSAADDVNNNGDIVGAARSADGSIHAFLWTEADGMMDLNTLVDAAAAGWTLSIATAINDSGWIVGSGLYDPDGPGGAAATTQAFLLRPVPEPAGGFLIGAALLLSRRRSRHQPF